MNPLIAKLLSILKTRFPKDLTSIKIELFNHVNGTTEIEFWVQTPKETMCFLDPRDMQDYVLKLEGILMYSDFEKGVKK